VSEPTPLPTGPVRWLLGTKEPLPASIRRQLESGLYTSLPIFFGGVFNSIAIATIAAWRQPSPMFFTWLALEIAIGLLRLPIVVLGQRAVRAGRDHPPAALAAFLSCAWAASVGYGACISLTSGDWVLATIVCLSAAAMVCGCCLRNFGTPRLAALMVLLMLGPSVVAGLMTGEAIMTVISVQLPIFIFTIFGSSFSLHRMLVSKMTALSALEKSELFNRTILESNPDYTLILDHQADIVFCNRLLRDSGKLVSLIGKKWLVLLPPEHRQAGEVVLATARAGGRANLLTYHISAEGQRRWFDLLACPISDGSDRIIIVSRDITHQKNSEERALWMARHDSLTRLPNRAVLQDAVDATLIDRNRGACAALLIVDVDNFKAINDTLGHDAGDTLLCCFADRLRSALRPGDLVTRTGGDEFAFLVSAQTEADVTQLSAEIFAALAEPFYYDGRRLDCRASIGASLVPRDGSTRSEIMKAADIALYAAKAGGRGRLKIFQPEMKTEVERREAMMASARLALQLDRITPWFQPKVSLGSLRVLGFEALMRWTDPAESVRGPEEVMAAFNDPALGAALSDRMIERTLDQMRAWLRAGNAFGHVALNATAADFRREGFAEMLIAALAQREIAPSLLQIEVTETVFLGRDSDHVEAVLRTLSSHGVKIALDDFGTGYASLTHLNQFPVDLLKIDRSFIGLLGRSSDAEAISCAVINLGHSLGLEVVAEGIETEHQEARLIELGCTIGQGFLYSAAVRAEEVPRLLASWHHSRPASVAAGAA
jgi:diguanylate cyclase (GGDEF)-like protein/PAS domain S-box-containing protein